MIKYLFLLGFFLFSISFLSGCKMSDFYSTPVTNADSAPVADTDSDLVANAAEDETKPIIENNIENENTAPVTKAAGPTVYKGIVYKNYDSDAMSCSREGMVKQLRGDVKLEGCSKGGFTSFVFFVEEEGETRDGRKFVHSFISSDDGETWDDAYLKVKKIMDIRNCKDADSYKEGVRNWVLDCKNNLAAYRNYEKNVEIKEVDMFGGLNRAPDSIKQ